MMDYEYYLKELGDYIKKLEDENRILRDQLQKQQTDSVLSKDLYPIELLFKCRITDTTESRPTDNFVRAYNSLKENNVQYLNELEGKLDVVLKYKNMGYATLASLIIVCRHYGIDIEGKDLNGQKKVLPRLLRKVVERFDGKVAIDD